MAERFILPFADVGSGILPSSGAELFFYENKTVGTDKDTFTGPDAGTPNANPVVANDNGLFPNIFISGTYSVVLKDKDGVQKWSADDVKAAGSFDDAFALNITKFPVVFSPGATTINIPSKPIGVNVFIGGVTQLESKAAYSYDNTTGDITGLTPLIAGQEVEVQFGLIVPISPDNPSPAPVKDLVNNYGAKGDAVYSYNANGEVLIASGTDDTQALLNAMIDFASGTIGALTIPDGNFWIDSSQIDTPTNTVINMSAGTNIIMSTTTPNLNTFVLFYQGSRVSNVTITGGNFIGSKVDDNTIGGTCIFALGATNVNIHNVSSEGSKGLAWFGEDVADLFGTKDVFCSNLRVTDCKLFSIYMRGVENPAVGFVSTDDTNNINIDGLIIRGSNVGFVCAEGRPFNAKITNYDCQDTDNLLQIEASDDIKVSNFRLSNATNVWNALSPAPFKQQWQISGSSDVSFVNGHIDAQMQGFAFGTSDVGCDNVSFTNITTGNFFRITTLNVQNDPDQFKGLFLNWSFANCSFPRDATTFFQSDVGDQSSPEIAYWRDWHFSACVWSNNSTNDPIKSVACLGSFVFDDKCVFNGKSPRALKGSKITFNATVRANGIAGSDMLFSAVPDLDIADQEILRLGGNIQIEGEVTDTNFDIVHDSGSYDSRSAGDFCRVSDATVFNDEGISTTGFNVNRFDLTVGTFKTLYFPKLGAGDPNGSVLPDYVGQEFITGSAAWKALDATNSNWSLIT